MASKSNKTAWVVLLSVLFCHATLVALPSSPPTETSLVRTLILDGLTPIEKFIDFTFHGIGTIWTSYFDLLDVRRENAILTKQNAELRMEAARNKEELRQAERLRRLLNTVPSNSGRHVVARVIGNDTMPGSRTITIDKGRMHGLFADAPVMTPDGLVGRVIHTGHFAAIVQLVEDRRSGIGIVVGENRVQGIVRGNGQDLILDLITDDAKLAVGDELLTSGSERIYPKGLQVGIIEMLGPTQDLMKTALIRPAADFSRLEEVFCLIDPPIKPAILDDLVELPPL